MNFQKINFLVYGSNEFFIQRKHLVRLAKDSGFFNNIFEYKPKDLKKYKKDRYSKILQEKKGSGFGCGNIYL